MDAVVLIAFMLGKVNKVAHDIADQGQGSSLTPGRV